MNRILSFLIFFIAIYSNGALASTANKTNTILIMGDSLSAGYGIQTQQSWPVLLQTKLNTENLDYKVHNASISGQTSSEGVSQIDQLLSLTKPDLVVLELGANDGLRGLSIAEMSNNLQTIISKSLLANSQVLLVGIRVPANYGRRYSAMFEASFQSLANNNNIPLLPFLLEPLLQLVTPDNKADYIQSDGLHPTEKSQPIILEHIYPHILSALSLPKQ